MTIQWFPGHMTKAIREIQEKLADKGIDMVIELRDSRIPFSSRNPLIDTLSAKMPRLVVLTKKDLADPETIKAWTAKLSSDTVTVIALDVLRDDTRSLVVEGCLKVMQKKFDRWKEKGIRPRKIKAIVLGIPNVGKSTLINQLAKRKMMTVANRPGVTMALKWANVHPQLDILDTPGLLWPKFDDKQIALNLALTGSIADKVLPIEDICIYAFDYITKHYLNAISNHYHLDQSDGHAFFEALARQRGCMRDNQVLLAMSYQIFLKDLRAGDLGRISFE